MEPGFKESENCKFRILDNGRHHFWVTFVHNSKFLLSFHGDEMGRRLSKDKFVPREMSILFCFEIFLLAIVCEWHG